MPTAPYIDVQAASASHASDDSLNAIDEGRRAAIELARALRADLLFMMIAQA